MTTPVQWANTYEEHLEELLTDFVWLDDDQRSDIVNIIKKKDPRHLKVVDEEYWVHLRALKMNTVLLISQKMLKFQDQWYAQRHLQQPPLPMPESKKSSVSPQPSTSMIQPVPLLSPKIVPPPQKDAYSCILQDFYQQERKKAAEKRKAAMELKTSKENKRPRYEADDRLKQALKKKGPKASASPTKAEKQRLDQSLKRAKLELEKRSYQPRAIR